MRLARFLDPAGLPFVGVQTRDEIVGLDRSIADILTLRIAAARDLLERQVSTARAVTATRTLAPIDGGTEVWAAGVTYRQSQQARMLESEQSADIYHRVYDAERPELFFKSTAWRVVGPEAPIAVRPDSAINVPEPELALVCNAFGEIVAFTVSNDVSSRSIEGENPLYLPQAKVYLGGCALGPALVPSWEIDDPYQLGIELGIDRDGARVWSGTASTAQLHRRFEDLIEHLFRADDFPWGVVISTGTCLVPDLPFTLRPGDTVSITIEGLGTLRNPVVGEKAEVRTWIGPPGDR